MTPADNDDTDQDASAVDLAARIADGGPVAWPADSTVDPNTRATMDTLRKIASVAALHRATLDDIAPPGANATQWGPLALIEKIAAGSFGEVYRAWDPRLERHVALKLLTAPAAADRPPSSRAIDEARLLARVRHPHVLTIHGAEIIDGRVGIWTEFIEGHTLEVVVATRGPLQPVEAVAIGIDLCRALAAVHAAGLLHRDIKSQNVMREDGGRIVLMDFGTVSDPSALTATGLAGTPLYLAPELLLKGASPAVASDLYALSVLLFHLLTGRFPIEGKGLDDVRAGHASGNRARLADLASAVPARLAQVIERGLAADPRERQASAKAFELELSRALGGQRRTWLAVAASVLTVALAGVAAWWLWPHAGPLVVAPTVPAAPASPRESQTNAVEGPSPVATSAGSAERAAESLMCLDCLEQRASVSPDGRFMVTPHRESGDLRIRNLATMEERRLFVKQGGFGESGDYALAPALSPDSQHVAFRWVDRATSASQLRVMAVRSGAVPTTLVDREAIPFLRPHDWNHDQSAILVTLGHRGPADSLRRSYDLAWVSVRDGSIKVVKSVESTTADPFGRARVSHDGRFIAFLDRSSGPEGAVPGQTGFGLFVMKADGTGEVALDRSASNKHSPIWTPNDAHIVYYSDLTGPDLWSIPVRQGRPTGPAQPIQHNVGAMEPLAITDDFWLIYGLFPTPLRRVSVIDLSQAAEPAPLSLVGFRPAWSRDGRSLAFIRRLGTEADTAVVWWRRGQNERIFPLRDLKEVPPIWPRDGQSILVPTQRVIHRLDLADGKFRDFLTLHDGEVAATAVLSPDERTVYLGIQPESARSKSFDRVIAIDVASRESRDVYSFAGPVFPGGGQLGLAVSPDGRTLAVSMIEGRNGRIVAVGADGANARQIATFEAQGTFHKVEWSGDGQSIFFAVAAADPQSLAGWQVMRMTVAGGTSVPVGPRVNGTDGPGMFTMQPYGSSIAIDPGQPVLQPFSEPGMMSALRTLDLARIQKPIR